MENKIGVKDLKKKGFFKFNNIEKYAMIIALVAISIFFQIATNGILLAPINVSRLVLQNSYVLLLAVGMLLCILTGDIDLSVGSIMAMVGAIVGEMIINYGMSVWLAVAAGLLAGILIGLWQGYWISYFRIPAFIVTLSGMLVFRGLSNVFLQGYTLAPFPESFQYIAQAYIPTFGLPGFTSTILVGILVSIAIVLSQLKTRREKKQYDIPDVSTPVFIAQNVAFVLFVCIACFWFARFKGLPFILVIIGVVAIVYSFITNKTVLGRQIYALGGNEKAAALSGIDTKKIKLFVFVNMGFLSAVSGIVFASRLNAASPVAGTGFELDAIAACYIGGASATGGVGTILGVIIGGLVMGVLNNGMSIMGIDSNWQQVVKGLVLLLAVAFDIINQKKK